MGGESTQSTRLMSVLQPLTSNRLIGNEWNWSSTATRGGQKCQFECFRRRFLANYTSPWLEFIEFRPVINSLNWIYGWCGLTVSHFEPMRTLKLQLFLDPTCRAVQAWRLCTLSRLRILPLIALMKNFGCHVFFHKWSNNSAFRWNSLT